MNPAAGATHVGCGAVASIYVCRRLKGKNLENNLLWVDVRAQ